MTKETTTFLSRDQLPIDYYKWIPEKPSKYKGAIQLAHGLAEHAARYKRFAQALTEIGYVVYANDHRGHGQTAGSPDKVGYFEATPFWEAALTDMHQLTQIIQKENQGIPIFLFGHSMGSFLCRHYITKWGNMLDGVILSATGGDPGILGKIGIIVAKLSAALFGRKERSNLLTKLSFGEFNTAFKPNRTDFDWLSREDSEVDKYIHDPYCGAVFTSGFWIDFLKGIQYCNSKEAYKNTPKNLPLLLIAGSKDPVGDMGKGVEQVHTAYKAMNLSDLQCTIYPDARHELLNEKNRTAITADLLEWIEQRCNMPKVV